MDTAPGLAHRKLDRGSALNFGDRNMDSNDVAEYLKQHPQFFDDHADVFAAMSVPHPHAGHAIPIAERQIISLRERVSQLELQMRELIRLGGENDTIGEKLHRSTL